MQFSVVIPVYNKEKHLSKTLESVLQQDFKNFEIIIVDDGSTDSSEKIIKSFVDPRIKYYKQENNGVSSARNAAIQKATAPYIALLDADDVWHPSYLAQMKQVIVTYSNESVFACACAIETTKQTLQPTYSNLSLEKGATAIVDYFLTSYINTILTSSSTIIKKTVFDTIGYYNEAIKSGEDTDLWIRLGLAYKVVFLNKALATYTFENSSLSNSPKQIKNTLNLDVYEKYTNTNKGLKKFLDLNRFALAIIAKRTGNKKNVKALQEKIAPESLNSKQRLLLNAPSFVIKILFQTKLVLEKMRIHLSTYK